MRNFLYWDIDACFIYMPIIQTFHFSLYYSNFYSRKITKGPVYSNGMSALHGMDSIGISVFGGSRVVSGIIDKRSVFEASK